ncbi:MAG: ATP-grasp domain-containing protein [Acidobacteria bacterium]|nr:ATP-grasp domain-containing protein [Acidobacteriota bacterium]
MDRPVVLIGATTWWQLSARMAMALLRQNCTVVAVCPPGHPLRVVSGISAIYPYKRTGSLDSLKAAIVQSKADMIVPCDDGVVWQLHALHAGCPELRELIEASLGPHEMYETIRSRGGLLGVAAELGIRVPQTMELQSKVDLERWPLSSGVLKLDGSWGGTGVEIADSSAAIAEAYEKLAKPKGAGFSWKRFVVNRDPLALWSWKHAGKPRVTIQQFIPGSPANAMFACWKGEVIGIVAVEVLNSQGATGSATVVQVIQHPEMIAAARKLAKRLSLHGFHGLDFILDKETNDAYLIELNPRCTQLGHLRLANQGDLAGAFIARYREKPPVPSDPIRGDTIAFFPQAFLLNPKNPYLVSGHHDVPWEEPALVRELLQGPWPERQWPARIYHFFRPPKRAVDLQIQAD